MTNDGPPDPPGPGRLTISQLAARANVKPGTLRMWESRHGFPRPARTSGGDRRYAAADVERVARVAGDREAGMSLRLAIRRVLDRPEGGTGLTLFAELRERRPDLDVLVLPKRALTALSRAIEHECCASGRRPLVYGSFQREPFYRVVQRRWRELSRTAEVAVAFADFATLARPAGGPVEIPLSQSSPLLREWSVVCDAPGFSACLVGWERPEQRAVRDGERAFEVLWSVEPEVVRRAARSCNARAERAVPGLTSRATARLAEPSAAVGSEQLRVAAALTSRMAAYVTSASDRPPRPA